MTKKIYVPETDETMDVWGVMRSARGKAAFMVWCNGAWDLIPYTDCVPYEDELPAGIINDLSHAKKVSEAAFANEVRIADTRKRVFSLKDIIERDSPGLFVKSVGLSEDMKTCTVEINVDQPEEVFETPAPEKMVCAACGREECLIGERLMTPRVPESEYLAKKKAK